MPCMRLRRMTLHPHRGVFLIQGILIPSGFYGMLAIGAAWGGRHFGIEWAALAAAAGWGIWFLLACVSTFAQLRKRMYQIEADRIVVRGGGVVSDFAMEVKYSRITHVKWIRPWLYHKWFGVGWIYLEVAGSDSGAIGIHGVVHSDEVVAEIRRHMAGVFSMSTAEILHEEKPATAGIIVDVILRSVWAVIASLFVLATSFGSLMRLVRGQELPDWVKFHPAWLLVGLVVAAFWLASLVLRFFDLKRREYRVHDGLIEYHEGFLTKHDAFIPFENLSNSSVTRGVAERVTNLYRVVVSCQGVGSEVVFLYLKNGPQLNEVLDRLIERANAPVTADATDEPALAAGGRPDTIAEAAVDVPPPLPGGPPALDREPESSYRMHAVRSIVPMLLYLVLISPLMLPMLLVTPFLVLVFVFPLVGQTLRIFRTTFRLRKNSVQESYSFFTSRDREFSNEKITGLVMRENLLDRLFGTITVAFWSIGDGREIVFQNVRKSEILLAGALRRARIRMDEPARVIRPEFSFGRFVSANLPLLVLHAFIAAVIAAIAIGTEEWLLALFLIPWLPWPVVMLARGYFYHPRVSLSLHPACMVFRKGIFVRETTYARHSNIKDVTTRKIPGYDCGGVRFNVAGERLDERNRNARGAPYGFAMRYMPDITRMSERFDYEVLARDHPELDAGFEPVVARKAIANSVVKTLLTGIIIFPLSVLLPVTVPLAARWASLVRYRIEPGRVLMQKGKLYRSQTSILFDRIDHIETRQGALNKLFKNGNIIISTAGSSGAELVLLDVKGHEAFHEALKRHADKPAG